MPLAQTPMVVTNVPVRPDTGNFLFLILKKRQVLQKSLDSAKLAEVKKIYRNMQNLFKFAEIHKSEEIYRICKYLKSSFSLNLKYKLKR